ncbi:hypothetical protein GWK47_004246 [Chionoecetes opilio]|uniref:Uncharacterized protein n=1 Tax=Chionoecetes opilio TaxID=41210 RepID=A0A8J4YMN2_CHIOP|nr:hypothetical protein GWK47_004246 [Chionoecetes opilio]
MVLCLGMCHKIPNPPVPEVRDEEPDKIPGYHHTEPYMGGSVCDSLILGCMPLQGVIPSVHRWPGEDDDTQAGEDGQDIPGCFPRLGRSWEVSPELFEKLQEITCHMYLPSTHTTEVNSFGMSVLCETWRGGVKSTPFLVRTASSCMHYVQNTRLRSGGEVCRASHLLRTQQTAAG